MDGLQGNMMAQPRMFGHDAIEIIAGADIPNTSDRGAVVYNGSSNPQDITILTEAGAEVEFKQVPSGTVVGGYTPMLATRLVVGTDCVAIY